MTAPTMVAPHGSEGAEWGWRSFCTPKAPVFGWASLWGPQTTLPSVDEAPQGEITTSGRAALYLALRQLKLVPGSGVLVPSYHCPTMVAPIFSAGYKPLFFQIDAEGKPDLDGIPERVAADARAMIVAHYFGLPHSLGGVRAWCDRHGIALIEDCAHALFGHAGERRVGQWGDFATASLSKFLPVPEAGVLVSNRGPLEPLGLGRRSLMDQIKGVADVVELGVRHGALPGLALLLKPILDLRDYRRARHTSAIGSGNDAQADASHDSMRACDMARIEGAPLWISRRLVHDLRRGRVVRERKANFDYYAQAFAEVAGARPLLRLSTHVEAPYVFPLWVDHAERVYRHLRAAQAPVFRWDRIWPGTPQGEIASSWSRHVLQLLCHQDLCRPDVARVAEYIRELIERPECFV